MPAKFHDNKQTLTGRDQILSLITYFVAKSLSIIENFYWFRSKWHGEKTCWNSDGSWWNNGDCFNTTTRWSSENQRYWIQRSLEEATSFRWWSLGCFLLVSDLFDVLYRGVEFGKLNHWHMSSSLFLWNDFVQIITKDINIQTLVFL